MSTALAGCFSTPGFSGGDGGTSGDDAGSGSGGRDGSIAASSNVVFVKKLPDGGLKQAGSLAALDALCRNSAIDAGFDGEFVAWFSTTAASAASRLPMPGGWVRPDNKPFALSTAALLRGEILYPARIDATGHDVTEDMVDSTVYTGTNADGSTGANCDDFNFTNIATRALIGHADGAKETWTHEEDAQCTQNGYIYCFQTNRPEAPAAPPAITGRAAFVTFASVSLSAGLAAFDQACTMAASDQKHYRAFVATSGGAAKDRFTVDGTPWIRPDYVVVTTNLVNFDAAISELSGGGYSDGFYVVSGAGDPTTAGTDATTCQNYSVSDTSHRYPAGKLTRSGPALFGVAADPTCSDAAKVYCLQYD